MKNAVFFYIFFFNLVCYSTAQVNLVPNPSFEQYSICPDLENQIPNATGWENWLTTPDYFNSCANVGTSQSVPYNCGGNNFQNAHGGNAYGGLFNYWTMALSSTSPWVREHVGIRLIQPLLPGTIYYLSMYVSLASWVSAPCASSKLGVKFTTQSFASYGNGATSPLVNNYAPIFVDTLLGDTADWMKISGSFEADSAYEYLVIGNFFDNTNTDTAILGVIPLCYSYYFIDDICLSSDSINCFSNEITKLKDNKKIIAYPNPFSSSTLIELTDWDCYSELMLFDILGQRIKFSYNVSYQSSKTVVKIERGNLRSDIYFLTIRSKEKYLVLQLIIY